MKAADPRPGLRDVEPYEAPQFDVPVRLNTNECPFPLPQDFLDDLAETVREHALNRYPDREARELRAALAEMTGRPAEGVWAANGSNEVIEQLLLAYGGPGRRVALFQPTYAMHSRFAWLTYCDLVEIPVEPPFVITSEHITRALEAEPHVVFVCSPNNPTGNAQPPEAVEELARAGELVIVDEAYIEFGGKTTAGLVASNPNVVVVRTFSKAFALAGARLGYCLASPQVIDDLRRVRLPYHLSSLTQAAGLAAMRHADAALAILDAVRRERDRILETLGRMEGVSAYPSDANFVLFRPPRPAEETWNALLERGVLVRDVSGAVEGCLRVTAGTTEEVGAFLGAMKEVA